MVHPNLDNLIKAAKKDDDALYPGLQQYREHFRNSAKERMLGIEIECIMPKNVSRQSLAEALTLIGTPATSQVHNHKTHWKVVPDGALGGNYTEIVSPVLQWKAGLQQVLNVLQVLNEKNIRINRCKVL